MSTQGTNGRSAMSLRDRKLSSGTGAASVPAVRVPPRQSGTGTPPGAHRGQGAGEGFGKTDRTDNWWVLPVMQGLGLLVLIGYANYAAILGAAHYHYIADGRDYLSPFYSPYMKPSWLPAWVRRAYPPSAPRCTASRRPRRRCPTTPCSSATRERTSPRSRS